MEKVILNSSRPLVIIKFIVSIIILLFVLSKLPKILGLPHLIKFIVLGTLTLFAVFLLSNLKRRAIITEEGIFEDGLIWKWEVKWQDIDGWNWTDPTLDDRFGSTILFKTKPDRRIYHLHEEYGYGKNLLILEKWLKKKCGAPLKGNKRI